MFERIFDFIVKINASGKTILLVEQNFIMASQLADRYTIIESGKSVKSGLMKDLVDDEETIRRYLGAT